MSGHAVNAPRCLVLGAGFSVAISKRMPLTDELGQQVLDELRADGPPGPASGTFTGGYFEAWLSRLAEPQPDLLEHVNLRNQAWFSQITEVTWEILARRQAEVTSEAPPPWLVRLVGLCHRTQSNIVTFNYDSLIEAVTWTVALWDWKKRTRAFSWHVLRNQPEERLEAGRFGWSAADSFRLIKLHGSLDCWWVSGDLTGATILRDTAGWAGFGTEGGGWVSNRPPGRSPFLVPPASAKSRFYANPVSPRVQWRL